MLYVVFEDESLFVVVEEEEGEAVLFLGGKLFIY